MYNMVVFGVSSMKHELLVPAGDMKCLYQAVSNGADAVYISGMNFGARKFATNFTNEELVEAIKYCHLYGVRLYVTMNTLIKNNEVDEFIEQARFLHKNGVDALIVQDFGMICLLRKKFPNLEIHASTQANNSSKDTCKLFYDLGVKRVVFSRELSLDEINKIDVPIEKEAFIHGALCVSYSGCCLMSSMLGGRSGNRGECAGSCRLPYSLIEDNKVIKKNAYLLSMKELNTSSRIKDLLNSSIYSFKIEGRMKSPVYVGFITRFYRRLIDGEKLDLKEENDKLKTIFNRDFTTGHIFENEGIELINSVSPNHVGLKIGKSLLKKDKIKIILDKNEVLHQFDAIRFLNSNKGMVINFLYDKNMNLCNQASNICYVDNKVNLTCNDIISKTQSYEIENEFKSISNNRKIGIRFKIKAKLKEPLIITITDGNYEFTESSNVVEKSINSPTDKNTFIKHLSKVNDTCFKIDDIIFDIDDDIFVQIKCINDMRRRLLSKLTEARTNVNDSYKEVDFNFERNDYHSNGINNIICSVYDENQLKICLENNVDRIYVKDKKLYDKYKSKDNVYLFLNRCLYDYSEYKNEKIVSSDYINFNNYNVYGNYSLNVTNIYTAYFLVKIGLKSIPLSVELTIGEILNFISLYNQKIGGCKFELLKYGMIENMVIKGNILGIHINNYKYKLLDNRKRMFPIYYDGINTHVFNYENRDLMLNGDFDYRFDFYNESSIEIENILKRCIK